MNKEKRYPIKLVSLRSGLSVHVIRAWEKRHHVVRPERTDTNRRLYSESDIEHLTILRQLTGQGHTIGNIADLSVSDLQQMLDNQRDDERRSDLIRESKPGTNVDKHLQLCLQAVIDFNGELFEERLNQASFQLTQPVLIHSIIIPLINQVGELWRTGTIRILHEHMATAVLKPFLANLRHAYRPGANAPAIIVTTPQGQHHEFGALIIALLAAAEGWRVAYLGPDLPADEIVAASMNLKAKIIALSIVYPANDSFLSQELMNLKKNIDPEIHIIVGGRISINYQDILDRIGATLIEDFDHFHLYLEKVERM